MSGQQIGKDLKMIIEGILKVGQSSFTYRRRQCQKILKNSSLKDVASNFPNTVSEVLPSDPKNIVQRASMIPAGVKEFASVGSQLFRSGMTPTVNVSGPSESTLGGKDDEEIFIIREEDLESTYVRSLGVEMMQPNEDGQRFQKQKIEPKYSSQYQEDIAKNSSETDISEMKLNSSLKQSNSQLRESKNEASSSFMTKPQAESHIRTVNLKPLSKGKPKSQLSSSSRQRKVPASRVGRLFSYGSLAAGLGLGAMSEITKRSLGLKDIKDKSLLDSNPFLSEANAERIVDTLCRVRGAALKLGQILSLQDNTMINPQLQKVFERVRSAADFMPVWQMEKMMVDQLGADWKTLFGDFDDKPFAAASIGQVHMGKLHDGRPVAIKIQYPGVAEGIESDIENLISVLNVWNIIPEGFFIDSVIEVAKRELGWEVDYIREKECAKKFKKLLEPYSEHYYVPDVIDELSTRQVYTTELIEGMPIDKCENLDQETRDYICYLLIDLFFKELFEFRYMQTDPNWSNFLYNTETKQIGLLDFGSSRSYDEEFVKKYYLILKGAVAEDREAILDVSRQIGFLTGYESKAMENAHVDTVLILGEALRIGDKAYNFGAQDITLKIQELVPIMVKERLCPPPEQVYSLHRKLSGIFLLCGKLQGNVKCKKIFENISHLYE